MVCVSDHEYPPRVAHTMMQRIGEDFAGQFYYTIITQGLVYLSVGSCSTVVVTSNLQLPNLYCFQISLDLG